MSFLFALFSVGVIKKEVGDECCLLNFAATGHTVILQFHEILFHRIAMKIALKHTFFSTNIQTMKIHFN